MKVNNNQLVFVSGVNDHLGECLKDLPPERLLKLREVCRWFRDYINTNFHLLSSSTILQNPTVFQAREFLLIKNKVEGLILDFFKNNLSRSKQGLREFQQHLYIYLNGETLARVTWVSANALRRINGIAHSNFTNLPIKKISIGATFDLPEEKQTRSGFFQIKGALGTPYITYSYCSDVLSNLFKEKVRELFPKVLFPLNPSHNEMISPKIS